MFGVKHSCALCFSLPGRGSICQTPVSYDYLILALGVEYAPESVKGLDPAAHTFYTWGGATALQQALRVFPDRGGTVAVAICGLPYKCPGAPHEGAMLIADYFSRRRGDRRVEVHLFTPEPQPLPVAGPTLGAVVQEMLRARGVVFHPLHKVSAVDGAGKRLQFEGREPVAFDLLVTIPPHRGPRVAREAGLTNDAGWVPVDRATLRTRYENVYAVGDMTAISIPGRWKPDVPLLLPKAGVFAHAEGEVVAHRIAAEVIGARAATAFDGYGHCMLEAGGGIAGMAFGNFFAEPSPQVELRRPGQVWHWGKVLFEQWWLAPPGIRRNALKVALALGARSFGFRAVA